MKGVSKLGWRKDLLQLVTSRQSRLNGSLLVKWVMIRFIMIINKMK